VALPQLQSTTNLLKSSAPQTNAPSFLLISPSPPFPLINQKEITKKKKKSYFKKSKTKIFKMLNA
jgi:hypothetical protein